MAKFSVMKGYERGDFIITDESTGRFIVVNESTNDFHIVLSRIEKCNSILDVAEEFKKK